MSKTKSIKDEMAEMEEIYESVKGLKLASKQFFLRQVMREVWNEKFKDIPAPSDSKSRHKFYLEFWDKLKINFSHPSNMREVALKHFYKNLKKSRN